MIGLEEDGVVRVSRDWQPGIARLTIRLSHGSDVMLVMQHSL